jgi:hypothetical protein
MELLVLQTIESGNVRIEVVIEKAAVDSVAGGAPAVFFTAPQVRISRIEEGDSK